MNDLPRNDFDDDGGIKVKTTASSRVDDRNGEGWARVVEERLKMGRKDGLENLPWLVEIDL